MNTNECIQSKDGRVSISIANREMNHGLNEMRCWCHVCRAVGWAALAAHQARTQAAIQPPGRCRSVCPSVCPSPKCGAMDGWMDGGKDGRHDRAGQHTRTHTQAGRVRGCGMVWSVSYQQNKIQMGVGWLAGQMNQWRPSVGENQTKHGAFSVVATRINASGRQKGGQATQLSSCQSICPS